MPPLWTHYRLCDDFKGKDGLAGEKVCVVGYANLKDPKKLSVYIVDHQRLGSSTHMVVNIDELEELDE